jgi:hypothetical protein
METRTTQSTVTFGRPFQLTGMDSIAPAGVYKLEVEEKKLDTISFESWRRTAVILQVSRAGVTEYVTLDPADLREALQRDGDLSRDSATPERGRRIRGQLRLRSQRA